MKTKELWQILTFQSSEDLGRAASIGLWLCIAAAWWLFFKK